MQLTADLVGHRLAVSSPQGRFEAGAALLDGSVLTDARAVGKHLLLGFAADGGAEPRQWLHVHLGLYGAWDLHGEVSVIGDATTPVASLGAPRVRRSVRMGEGERPLPGGAGRADGAAEPDDFPPPPVGQVRVRLVGPATVADLRAPITCEVLTPEEVDRLVAGAGPDPRVDAWDDPEAVVVQRVTSRRVAVGQLLMDPSVVSGIGNIYRAELLHRAALDPYTPGNRVPREVVAALWQDWVRLLDDGVREGMIITRADLDAAGRAAAVLDPAERHAVYGRTGLPCRRCGTTVQRAELAGRWLYWCPGCQH